MVIPVDVNLRDNRFSVKPKLFISEALVYFLIVFAAAFFAGARCEATAVEDSSLPRITANTNQHAAGTLSKGGLTVELEIREGAFYPEDESGPSLAGIRFRRARQATADPRTDDSHSAGHQDPRHHT